jgi:hypothetical protein
MVLDRVEWVSDVGEVLEPAQLNCLAGKDLLDLFPLVIY